MINTWKGKDPLKKNELSFLNNLTKGPSANVYYHWFFICVIVENNSIDEIAFSCLSVFSKV